MPTGDSSRLTPPTRAASHSPLRMLWQARCRATSEDEQAVSSATLGPCKPKANERRLAARHSEVPVAAWASVCERSLASIMPYSLTEMPMNTPVFEPRSLRGRQAGVLQGFPGQLQQHALLRIDPRRLAVGDAEEVIVELVDPLQEAAPARVHLPGAAGSGS